MSLLQWELQPPLERPTLLAAFAGWNDAGDAATLAIDYLAEAWGAKCFASFDPEELYDFTATRPQVRLAGGGVREIDWPRIEMMAATAPASGRDVVLLRGAEPQLRWRSFCESVVAAARALKVDMAIILGALLADVPHTRPVRVSGTTADTALARRLGLAASTYEGPTGIVGVLHDALSGGGIPAASFWAAVPHYVQGVSSPKAALALLERTAAVLGVALDDSELREAAAEYERQVSARVVADAEAAAYVAELEAEDDRERAEAAHLAGAEDLAAEAERWLRGRHREG